MTHVLELVNDMCYLPRPQPQQQQQQQQPASLLPANNNLQNPPEAPQGQNQPML